MKRKGISEEIPKIENSKIPQHSFITLLSSILRLPEETTALAFVYYHRYHRWIEKISQDESLYLIDDYTLAISSLSLASKATEQFRRMREFLVPAYSIINPSKPRLTFPSEFYDSLRDSVVNAELILLRVLKFDIKIILPFSYLTKALHLTLTTWHSETTDPTLQKEKYLINTAIGRYARCRIMDAISDYRLSTLYDPQTLSSACLWHALRDFRIFPEEKFLSWVLLITGSTEIHEDIQDAIYDLAQLDLRRHEQRKISWLEDKSC
ncbi:unnamed protein product [Pneumocystis jirovecii]|uniref:Cyclin N-terminal domain-containing protein n=2 Tax=Pneumocystis jirovecii TaxID=42068 RepID=L0PCM7_PNEJI|nr:uncharacterized protein T551_03617 [Pneumocystis jirovecii RU7]KTW26045.1 hypothetical protein T551_03617 [Pneumocystis jirovecii RU7]CCJ30123.1 unnamed protein product [Pneumocystis jirovecii]